MIYTVTFNPAIDYFVGVGNFNIGKVNRANDEHIFFGGKGINVSVMLRRLGIESVALGFVAGFTGKAIEDGLRAEGIKTDFIHLSAGFSRINVKINHGTETELNGQGPTISEEALSALLRKLDTLAYGDALVLAGSVPSSLPADIYSRIAERISGRGVRLVVDASGELLRGVLRYKPFLIKPNHHELAEFFGEENLAADDIIRLARRLQDLGAENVLVSCAGAGALLIDSDGGVHNAPAANGTVVNSVGAGDSMVAGFLAGLYRKKDYGYALTLGSAAGGATAFSAGLGELELIEKLFSELS